MTANVQLLKPSLYVLTSLYLYVNAEKISALT